MLILFKYNWYFSINEAVGLEIEHVSTTQKEKMPMWLRYKSMDTKETFLEVCISLNLWFCPLGLSENKFILKKMNLGYFVGVDLGKEDRNLVE